MLALDRQAYGMMQSLMLPLFTGKIGHINHPINHPINRMIKPHKIRTGNNAFLKPMKKFIRPPRGPGGPLL